SHGAVAAAGERVHKAIRIEVLGGKRQRVSHVLVPVGAAWPGPFTCVCKMADDSGRIIIPVLEHDRLLGTAVLTEIGPEFPPGTDVELQLTRDEDTLRLEVFLPTAGRREMVRVPLVARTELQAAEEQPAELKPDWADFARLVKDCLILGGEV